MARKPNYGYEKRQKELAKKAKKEEKRKELVFRRMTDLLTTEKEIHRPTLADRILFANRITAATRGMVHGPWRQSGCQPVMR